MSNFNLKVNVKDHKLNCKPECLQNIRPVFNVNASSYSCTTQRRINSEPIENQPQTQQITGGQSKQQSGQQIQKPSESNLQKSQGQQQQQMEKHHEDKTSVDITMRDGNTGELLGRGHLEFDPSKKKETKYEEKVTLKDLWGNEIGYANVEIEQEKLSEKELGFDDQFRHMRREMKQMMRDTNRIFGNFSRRFLGRNYGFDLLDDFRSMMLEDQPSGWNPSLENEPRSQQSGGTQQQGGSQQQWGSQQQKGSQQQDQQQWGNQQQKGSQQQGGSQQQWGNQQQKGSQEQDQQQWGNQQQKGSQQQDQQQQWGNQQQKGSQQDQQQWGTQQQKGSQQKDQQQQQWGTQQQSGSQPSGMQGSQSQRTQPMETQEDMSRRTQEKKGNVEITEEKPIA